ncbi:MAG: arsenate reductase/protein-tyrosine-phosphatase family protein [Actinomycetota bacterium]
MAEHKRTPKLTQAARARIHASLGDPTRVAIADALVDSDLRPGELARDLGIGTNLLAHHLDVLEDAGLLVRTASHADARRKYLRIRVDVLRDLLPIPAIPARRLLFVCTHNSARSQMASALWNRRSTIPSESAGVDPAPKVNPLAIQAAARHGVDLRSARPRSYEEVRHRPDLIISVCDRAREALPPFDAQHLHWSVPDPVESGRPADFEKAFRQIVERIEDLSERVGLPPRHPRPRRSDPEDLTSTRSRIG